MTLKKGYILKSNLIKFVQIPDTHSIQPKYLVSPLWYTSGFFNSHVSNPNKGVTESSRYSLTSIVWIIFPEFQKIAIATAIGFAIMGFIGFFVKLIHIPINNIIVGA